MKTETCIINFAMKIFFISCILLLLLPFNAKLWAKKIKKKELKPLPKCVRGVVNNKKNYLTDFER